VKIQVRMEEINDSLMGVHLNVLCFC